MKLEDLEKLDVREKEKIVDRVTDFSVLDDYSYSSCEFIRHLVGYNSYTSPETLDRLANDEKWEVSYGVARNPNTSPKTLDRLADDALWEVRFCVAINLNTPPKSLDRLVNDKSYVVRLRISERPDLPQYLKDYLKIKEFLNYYGHF